MKRSFADFEDKEKLACFSDKNDKRPHEIAYATGKKFIFECRKCGHQFAKSISKVTIMNRWCPYCGNQELCGDKSCLYCFEKSYENHSNGLAKHWSDKNEKKAHEVYKRSGVKYFHHCVKCDHHFFMSPEKIGRGAWCNFCANRARCPESANCDKCFQNTFASYSADKVACWSSSNERRPYDFALYSHRYALFDCQECSKSFRKMIAKAAYADQWCPECASNKASRNVESISAKLMSHEKVKFTKENVVKCSGRHLRWDFVVANGTNTFYIENDGIQHFSMEKNMMIRRVKDIEVGKAFFVDQRVKDLLKDEHILTNNKLLFRVSYRQLDMIERLVETMIEKSNAGATGVVYMDKEMYKDWGPIVYEPEESENR